MTLHHIGVASKDIDRTASLLSGFGYTAGDTKFDAEQNVHVKFLKAEGSGLPCLELVMPGGGMSPIDKVIARNGTCVYHLCYEVDDIEAAVQKLRKEGYFPTGEKTRSVIGGRFVIFLFHTDNCLIELLEKEK